MVSKGFSIFPSVTPATPLSVSRNAATLRPSSAEWSNASFASACEVKDDKGYRFYASSFNSREVDGNLNHHRLVGLGRIDSLVVDLKQCSKLLLDLIT